MRTIWGKMSADWGWQKDHDITIILIVLTVKMPSKDTTKYITLKLKGNVACMSCSTVLNRRERSLNMTTIHLILTTPASKSEPASANQGNS